MYARALEPWVASELLPRFHPPPREQWQPSDFLPDAAGPAFEDSVRALRAAASELPNDLLAVAAGAAAAAAAGANRLSLFNAMEGVRDETGAQQHAYARWGRAWAAEEARHARALSGWLYLSGRADGRALSASAQRLVGGGVDDGGAAGHPYKFFALSALQEGALKAAHGNAARLAGYHGAGCLSQLLAALAADDARHEAAAAALVGRIFAEDPEGAVVALAEVVARGVVMPGARLDDGWHAGANAAGGGGQNAASSGGGGGGATALYRDYAAAADALGVLTVADHAAGLEQLLAAWGVADLRLSGAAAAAQQLLVGLPASIRRLGELQLERRLRDRRRGLGRSASFSWIHKREVALG
ncbi:MAG: fatty acid desaturase-domain-containing protein [Monoraphidium minutum]|nr:MAG: fatty acid desaturase-domain-containing protein [Monoraphidium minutum]